MTLAYADTPRSRRLSLLVRARGAAALAAAARADASSPCADSTDFACATLPVPLDRSGRVPGTISLASSADARPRRPQRDAVIALAGGPGQAALPLGEFIAKAMAPALGTRDLLVFDQRGTGDSDPLACPALSSSAAARAGQRVRTVRAPDRARARRLHDPGIGRRHRGDPPGGRL